MSELVTRTRPAAGEPAGLLVLHHGRGADENDLLALAEALDPRRRLLVVSPRAPLPQDGAAGYRWYLVPSPGQPDAGTFASAERALGELHDELWRQTGIPPERTVLGGFSQGAVMSYALALAGERPPPAGVMAWSGFFPRFAGWEPHLDGREHLRAFISHGERDRVIDVAHGREAAERLRRGGIDVCYLESPAAHHIDPRTIADAASWLDATLPARLVAPQAPKE